MIVGKRLQLLLFLVAGLFIFSFTQAGEYAEILEKGKYVKKECITLSDKQIPSPKATVNLSQYGGWMEKRLKPTGFFHTQKQNDRWWIIDPDGYAFISIGINSVNLPNRKTDEHPTTDEIEWGKKTFTELRTLGFNTLGCWSDDQIVRKLEKPMPYCLRWNFMSNYRKERRKKYPATDKFKVIYPFDPEYESFCERHARQTIETKNDPWLFGHFSDNELPFQEKGIVNLFLRHPKDDPNHLAANKFMKSKGRQKPTRQDDRDFQKLVVETHYRKVADAIRKHDPNHMYLGTRFHGMALHSPGIFEAAGKYTDIISVNYYHRWTPETERLENWSKLSGKPILITEWYAMAEDSGLPTTSFGAGFPVRTQQDRANFYEHFTLGLLEIKSCVGWHWFKYRDRNNNAGMVRTDGKPYEKLSDAMQKINTRAYPLSR